MSVHSQFPTPDTSLSEVRAEQSHLDGTVLCGAAYGVHLTLFIQCFSLLAQPQGRGDKKRDLPLLAYICVIFALGTAGFGGQLKFRELMFIQGRELPGGPLEYQATMFSSKLSVLSNAAFVVCNWLTDGLLIYRLRLIWNGRWLPIVITPPILMLLGSIVTSILLLVQLTHPDSTLTTGNTINFGLAYWPISVSINVLVTSLIVGRLLYFRARVRHAFALAPDHGRMYTSVVAMLIESAALYTVVGLLYIGTYATKNVAANVLVPVLGEVQAISPLLIILRVAQGRAWTKDTMHTIASFNIESTTRHAVSGIRFTTTDSLEQGTSGTAAIKSLPGNVELWRSKDNDEPKSQWQETPVVEKKKIDSLFPHN